MSRRSAYDAQVRWPAGRRPSLPMRACTVSGYSAVPVTPCRRHMVISFAGLLSEESPGMVVVEDRIHLSVNRRSADMQTVAGDVG